MNVMHFEAVKVALKQDKTGFVLTLCLHPDDIPEDLMRDFVGARYQVGMVRINSSEQPMDRAEFDGERAVRLAGAMCRDPEFCKYLQDDLQIIEATEKEAVEWLRNYLQVSSRSELKENANARELLDRLQKEFLKWKKS
jgi:hypothetical protein